MAGGGALVVACEWWGVSSGGHIRQQQADTRTQLRTQVEASPWLGSGHMGALAKQGKTDSDNLRNVRVGSENIYHTSPFIKKGDQYF